MKMARFWIRAQTRMPKNLEVNRERWLEGRPPVKTARVGVRVEALVHIDPSGEPDAHAATAHHTL